QANCLPPWQVQALVWNLEFEDSLNLLRGTWNTPGPFGASLPAFNNCCQMIQPRQNRSVMKSMLALIIALGAFSGVSLQLKADDDGSLRAPSGWRTGAPREEIRPAFVFEPTAGREGKGALVIQHDARDGLDGFWTKTFAVRGGQFY